MARKHVSRTHLAKVRKEVFTRDNWTCQRCGTPFPPARPEEASGQYAPGLDGTGVCLELDHIVPVVVGGLFLPENLQALCSRCNASKGASTEFAGWPERIERARQILNSHEPSASTARKAVLILLGRTV